MNDKIRKGLHECLIHSACADAAVLALIAYDGGDKERGAHWINQICADCNSIFRDIVVSVERPDIKRDAERSRSRGIPQFTLGPAPSESGRGKA